MWFKKGFPLLLAAGAYGLYRQVRKPDARLGFSTLTVTSEPGRLLLRARATLDATVHLDLAGPAYHQVWQGQPRDGWIEAALPPAPPGDYRFTLAKKGRRKNPIVGSFRVD